VPVGENGRRNTRRARIDQMTDVVLEEQIVGASPTAFATLATLRSSS
jgi:hypothetical protein